jgi:hypothetical protein
MGKSVRSKVMKRFRTVKRQLIASTVDMDRLKDASLKCQSIAAGHHFEVKPTLNAFRHPGKADAEIPCVIVAKSTDFRSEALPNAGYAACRNRRKKNTKSTVVVASYEVGQETMDM